MGHSVRIECACKLCAKNAHYLGKPLPLAAFTNAELVAKVNGKFHGLVHLAHDPVVGRWQDVVIPA